MKKAKLFVPIILVLFIFSCKNEKRPNSKINETSQNQNAVSKPSKEETNSSVSIIPIEHATAILQWNDITVYIDPVGGAKAFEGQELPDLILITDIHGDHLSVETLQELNTSRAKIIAPKAVADKLPEEFTTQLDILANGESKKRFGITVEAIAMYNLREEAKNFHEKGRGNGYVLKMGDQRIYFSGDTEDIPEMRSLKNIDMAFVCMNLPYTMTVESAAKGVLAFKPKQVYPYHYRGKPDVSDVAKFKELVNTGNPDIEVVQLDWYPNNEY
ncbi:MBL fold metallo-hydrolase [Maribacter thermophilus]|uniref:MBL fold metallo-hydrolase n=1 Tax=Maribacter thermophilus TaxID=1197874 RepID=UPI0006414CF9|nr:MBL fold metallo-hydrolase [Maribacter thermophilus]